jgi:flagellar motor switch protein FliN/FliY
MAEETTTNENQSSEADSKIQAQPAVFPDVAEGNDTGAGGGMSLLLEMKVLVTVTIGETDIPVRRLLQLGPGSVLRLDKPIDAPADVYIRDTKFAAGNIVVVDNQFAVRIKQIYGIGDIGADN